MLKQRFLVLGELGWRLALENVVMDDLSKGQALADAWWATPAGSTYEVANVLQRNGHLATIYGLLGDDVYGKLVINQLNLQNIDSSLIKITDALATTIFCDINQGKKDSLAISARSKKHLEFDLASIEIKPDWFYLTDGVGDLNQVSECLHQACLYQARTIWQVTELDERELRRFAYLLEDVDVLLTNDKTAKLATSKRDLESCARALLNDLEYVIIVAKKKMLVATENKMVTLESSNNLNLNLTELGAAIVAGLARVSKSADLARVLLAAWQTMSSEKVQLREKSL